MLAEPRFDFTAQLTYVRRMHATALAVQDDTNAVVLYVKDNRALDIRPGDRLHVTGAVRRVDRHKSRAEAMAIELISRGPPPEPAIVSLRELLQGRFDYRLVTTSVEVRDCCRSETSAAWAILAVGDGNDLIYVSVPINGDELLDLEGMIGSSVMLTGVTLPGDYIERRSIGRTLKVADKSSVSIVGAASGKDIPSIDGIGALSPYEIAALGRHVASGRVVAVWACCNALLKSEAGSIHGLTFKKCPPPSCGQAIEAIGFPESDLFRINLTHASWRPIGSGQMDDVWDSPLPISVRDLIMDDHGTPSFSRRNHGVTFSVIGEMLSFANDGNGFGRMYVRSEGVVFPVELAGETLTHASTIPRSSQVGVVGVCVLDTEGWRPNSAFPQIQGFRLVTRSPDDVQMKSLPPFWTAPRLFAVIGILLGLLVSTFVLTLVLRRVAERKSHELARETIARIASDLKVAERTHLAIELHDTLSQMITGACLEVNAAQEFIGGDLDAATSHLDLAAKTLGTCRNELRCCLWDLRSRALEESDVNVAIRRTLDPYVGDCVSLSINFNAPRKELSDNIMHALMRIVRELVINAIRHGKATSVSISGRIDGRRLRFRVGDNGRGFDPGAAPGSATGHFGLQGIRERIRDLDGEMAIDSAPGAGTNVDISISLEDLAGHQP